MAKVKYYAKDNSSIGTHSFYAVPIPNGTLTFDELLDEAMDGKAIAPSEAKAALTAFMKAVKRNVLKGKAKRIYYEDISSSNPWNYFYEELKELKK